MSKSGQFGAILCKNAPDTTNSSVSTGRLPMKIEALREIAKQHDIKAAGMKKHDLVRAIQKHEGNQPCFKSGHAEHCGQHHCLWREECV
jgi:hypothetical protein